MTNFQLAARALRHRAEEAIVLAERMEAKGVYQHAAKAYRDEAEACLRVAEGLDA